MIINVLEKVNVKINVYNISLAFSIYISLFLFLKFKPKFTLNLFLMQIFLSHYVVETTAKINTCNNVFQMTKWSKRLL